MRKRTRRSRRIVSARKVNHRREVAKKCWWLNYYINQPDGKFAERLFYNVWSKNKSPFKPEPSLSDKRKIASLNNRMEDFYNETH